MLGGSPPSSRRWLAPRRSHHKSKRGCLTCKRRRVKCDEIGPPCTNCRNRDTYCKYASPIIPQSCAEHATSSSYPDLASQESGPRFPYAAAISPGRRRGIELRLLHRWSTSTYESVATEAIGDQEIWQKMVPEVALKNEFLLNIIFALTAFEIAFSYAEDHIEYFSLALEYQDLAFCSFRDHLQSLVSRGIPSSSSLNIEEGKRRWQAVISLAEYIGVDPSEIKQDNVQTLGIDLSHEEHDAMLYASLLLTALTLASATAKSPSPSPNIGSVERQSAIELTVAQYEMTRSASIVMMSKADCITTHELFRKVPETFKSQKRSLDDEVERIMTVLGDLNEERLAMSSGGLSGANQVLWTDAIGAEHAIKEDRNGFDDIRKLADALDLDTRATPPLHVACRNALTWLRYMFQTCVDEGTRVHCLAWLTMAGKEYMTAVNNGDRIALLILAGWGVVMQPLGDILWYGRDYGALLVKEISEHLKGDSDERVLRVLAWAKDEIRRSNKKDVEPVEGSL